MERLYVVIAIAVLLAIPTSIWGTEDHTSKPRMEFIVASAGPKIQVLEDVEVLLVKKDGLVVLGRTSGVGVYARLSTGGAFGAAWYWVALKGRPGAWEVSMVSRLPISDG